MISQSVGGTNVQQKKAEFKNAAGQKAIQLYESLQKCVLREVMQVDTVADSQILKGSLFQCLGAAVLKALSP